MIKYALLITLILVSVAGYAHAQQEPAEGVSVFVATVTTKRIADSIEALGTLRANETVTLSANVTDIVTAIRFDDGQRVTAGDVLIEMANAAETAELKEAQANVNEASRQVRRLKPLVDQGAASRSALDTQNRNLSAARAQFEAIKARLADRIITAPFDGIVGLRNISIGALLQPGTTITTLDDDSVMKLDFSIPSTFLSSLQPELPIEARTAAYPDTIFTGKVASIASQIDPASRSVTVRAIIPNESRLLRPGLLMTVHLKKNERTAIMVPELAVIVEGANKYVYTVEDGRAIKKQVAIGLREPGYVEITDGLSPGETIVTDGILKLSDQTPVRVSAKRTAGDTLADLLQQSETATVQE